MSCAPSGATPTVSTTPDRGEWSWMSPRKPEVTLALVLRDDMETQHSVLRV